MACVVRRLYGRLARALDVEGVPEGRVGRGGCGGRSGAGTGRVSVSVLDGCEVRGMVVSSVGVRRHKKAKTERSNGGGGSSIKAHQADKAGARRAREGGHM